jgi:hypothetical protein
MEGDALQVVQAQERWEELESVLSVGVGIVILLRKLEGS